MLTPPCVTCGVVCTCARADDSCTHKVKYEPFDIPVAQFEATLINALQQIGVNAAPKRRN